MELGSLGPFGVVALPVLLVLAAFIALGRIALAVEGLRCLWAKPRLTAQLWLGASQVAVAGLSIAAGADGWLDVAGMRAINLLQLALGLALIARFVLSPAR